MFTRLIAFLKRNGITAVFCGLTGRSMPEAAGAEVSSLMDTWMQLPHEEGQGGRRQRVLRIAKSRGMPHASEGRRFQLTDNRIVIEPAARHSGALSGGGLQAAGRG